MRKCLSNQRRLHGGDRSGAFMGRTKFNTREPGQDS